MLFEYEQHINKKQKCSKSSQKCVFVNIFSGTAFFLENNISEKNDHTAK